MFCFENNCSNSAPAPTAGMDGIFGIGVGFWQYIEGLIVTAEKP